ncbi:zinc finger CCHC domain-containing protein 3-like [Salvelinus fontinalis]|uniref:zinc finger CCHC domain-containing protein 3-like n=1 Tax=Salvelinus fontinalis TaxID=8038 RepID=UPI0024867F39|nr:zinc finger CCHC domain-containing protein 3-like [Salvelinus fontinalis]
MRVLTVHMFNPWVTEETLVCYLSRYVTILPGVRNIKDALGIWTGKRQFRVLLKEDESGHGGYRHPPASFSIGADRGYLMYAGQPHFCRKCSTYGHLADACTQTRCRNCGTLGHIMSDCTVPKRCSLCNSENHLFRHCPKAAPSYARAVSGKRADEGESMELRAIEEVVDELVMERELRESEESGSETPSSSHEESGETDRSWNNQVEEEKGEPTAPSAPESWTTGFSHTQRQMAGTGKALIKSAWVCISRDKTHTHIPKDGGLTTHTQNLLFS